jgi:hypothetical protein
MLFDVPIRSPELRRCFWKADDTLNFTLWPDQGEGANHEKLSFFSIWTAALLCMSGASGLANTSSGVRGGMQNTAVHLEYNGTPIPHPPVISPNPTTGVSFKAKPRIFEARLPRMSCASFHLSISSSEGLLPRPGHNASSSRIPSSGRPCSQNGPIARCFASQIVKIYETDARRIRA